MSTQASTLPDTDALREAVAAQRPLAERLFNTLRERSADSEGVTRPGWSEAEQAGAELVAEEAGALGLEVTRDAMGQIAATLPGRERKAPRVLMGSHLDSVPKGGNFDGFAGVAAGLTALAALRALGVQPATDLCALGLRGEESVWYGVAYLGSRFAVGDMPWDTLNTLTRVDTGKSLAEHAVALGSDPKALRKACESGKGWIGPENTRAYLELHIEQGPVLESMRLPLAIPTAIRGNLRYPLARCLGRYGHSAATPVDDRRDAVLATAALLDGLHRFWRKAIAGGVPDTAFTVGQLHTDAGRDAMTIIPGECSFSLNIGGTTQEFIEDWDTYRGKLAAEIEAEHNVRFEFGGSAGSVPVALDSELREALLGAARELSTPCHEMATVGHDAATFAKAGIPAAMILVRNQHSSHNPEEAMALEDFMQGVEVLTRTVLGLAG